MLLERPGVPDPVQTPPLRGVKVLSRVLWNPAPVVGTPRSLAAPHRITLHHLGEQTVTDSDPEAVSRLLHGIQSHHQQGRGWSDIAYHYVIDRAGRIWEGRSVSLVGAHAGSPAANRGNIGILLLGNFNVQKLSAAQDRALGALLEALRKQRGIDRGDIRGHDEVRRGAGLAPTECPGKNLSRWLEEYRKEPATEGTEQG
jgi:N-acetyl-anhydromuramyl-L-alanine amidase AmpD